ncbi:unnamed protein product [Cyprideis torosa]|uniref:Uncharacterized protein n=1 Tax=Cyprideis torosa TaxID=163714 RepID=A0A7R8ZHH8_9CRUS|nr:unnamed protein product [Cyprideis torosa]CAG0883732.1 unnamed protein product [Cyprideis torosa]
MVLTMEGTKVIPKSNTLSSLTSSGGQKLGGWLARFGERRNKKHHRTVVAGGIGGNLAVPLHHSTTNTGSPLSLGSNNFSLKVSKSITLGVVHENPRIGSDGESEEISGASDDHISPVNVKLRPRKLGQAHRPSEVLKMLVHGAAGFDGDHVTSMHYVFNRRHSVDPVQPHNLSKVMRLLTGSNGREKEGRMKFDSCLLAEKEKLPNGLVTEFALGSAAVLRWFRKPLRCCSSLQIAAELVGLCGFGSPRNINPSGYQGDGLERQCEKK